MPTTINRNSFGWTSFAQRLNNLYWEFRLGISTRRSVEITSQDSYRYSTMIYSTIHKILKHLNLQPSDIFVDIGSGKGRVLCCAALYKIKRVVGIELSTELSDEAQVNAQKMHGRKTPINIYSDNATNFDYSEMTVCFLFNPFGAITLDNVLNKIRKDIGRNHIRLAYANPAHIEIFAKHDWLEQYEFWVGRNKYLDQSVAFFRSRN